MTERSRLGDQSKFWQALGEEHTADLERFGLDAIKRHQAFRYFTWQWSWRSLHKSRQMGFLLAHSRPTTLARCLVDWPDVSDDEWAGVEWSRRDRWLYVAAVRLLWDYARRHDATGVLELPEPRLGSPLPVRWRGRLISQDLANTALETTAIWRALAGVSPKSIMEVGAGYGRTAYALLSVFPESTYTVVDIEPALTISSWYLGQLFPRDRVRFLTPDDTDAVPTASADLVVSVSSLQEMTPEQVAAYLNLFDRIARGVVYLKQRSRWRNPTDGVELAFDEYPVPRAWRLLFDGPAPVQSDFREAAWKVPANSADCRRRASSRFAEEDDPAASG